MNDRISLPKDRIRILLLEGIADSAVELFADADYATIQREKCAGCTSSASAPAPRSARRCWPPPTG
jgi:hypothetical protein